MVQAADLTLVCLSKAYVRTQAMEYVVDPQLALWIAKHESSFTYRGWRGEAGDSGKPQKSIIPKYRTQRPSASDV